MGTRLRYWLSLPSLVRSVVRNARLAVRLLREPRVPVLLKAVPLLGLAYVIWPLDALPDVFPIIGELDDLTLIVLAIERSSGCAQPSRSPIMSRQSRRASATRRC